MEWMLYSLNDRDNGLLADLAKHPLMDARNIFHFIRCMTGNPMPVVGIPSLIHTIRVRETWNDDGDDWGNYVHYTIGVAMYAHRVYIADRRCIRVIDSRTGQLEETWTSTLITPNGICWYRSELFVVDTYRHCVSVFNGSGECVREWSVYASASITGITVNDDGVFVTDKTRRCIFVYSSDGELRACWEPHAPDRPWRVPMGLSSNHGELFIADTALHQIHVLDSRSGAHKRSWGGAGVFKNPQSVALCLDVVFVTDAGHQMLQAFRSCGQFLCELRPFGEGGAAFTRPSGVCTDGQRLFVTDYFHSRVTVFSTAE